MQILVQAPSNIALVKYMGKISGSANLPENPSISMTLNHLCTLNEWNCDQPDGPFKAIFHAAPFSDLPPMRALRLQARPIEWNEKSILRFQNHVDRCLSEIPRILDNHSIPHSAPQGIWSLKSGNTFPTASGIASSASSFSALTLGMARLFCLEHSARFENVYESAPGFRRDLAIISRKGSGSSCRSFEGPWVEWLDERTHALPAHSSLVAMTDFVLLISQSEKSVSSSEAHSRIKSSPLWKGRIDRTKERAGIIETSLLSGDWPRIRSTVWTESWEMHSLFHTAQPPFTYWEPQTLELLKKISVSIERSELNAAVTMDAGPNIHLIVPTANSETVRNWLGQNAPGLKFLEDTEGKGARSWVYR